MATAIKIPNPNKTGTPKGMEGVRPGSPKAVAAGFKPPKPPKPPKPTSGPAAAGATIQTPPKTQTVTTTTSTPPGRDWWTSQIGAGVNLSASKPVLEAERTSIGSSYGLTLRRNPSNNQPLFRLATDKTGTGTIEQSGFDERGNPVYKDAAGNVVDVTKTPVLLDYVAVKPGEEGYLQGALGRTAATSANTQQSLADAAAARGARRSGMREFGARNEASNLQSALLGLSERAGGEYSANLGRWADLYDKIYQGLVPKAAELATPVTTTTEVPVAPEVPAATSEPSYLGYNQAPTPPSGALSGGPGGQFMTLIGDVTLERNTNDAAIRQGLRALLNNSSYKLTAQQKAYINSLITGRYKGNKKY